MSAYTPASVFVLRCHFTQHLRTIPKGDWNNADLAMGHVLLWCRAAIATGVEINTQKHESPVCACVDLLSGNVFVVHTTQIARNGEIS